MTDETDKPKAEAPPDPNPRLIKPPRQLADKVTRTPDGVDTATLERAEKMIASLQGSYLEWVEGDLERLQKAHDQAEAALAAGGDPTADLKALFEVAHDMKGQGGSFNYHLITQVGAYLCRFLEQIDPPAEKRHLEIAKVHVDTMRLVVSQRLEGDGGPAGKNLIRGLEAVLAKHRG
ncbi:Hpt domain-containing protein [Roseospirillum parvum]|uniref:Hpt domain-containing protein n=1 Tax=Roseospirillum parvum TaxID=83401 RepID=A0A1G7WKV2_9PROT|nr:Hpt domain-containing protein [Roseospirillum parvum]SDG72627.1 Hpt domain-containing protein [Roseospirillum parvum]